MAALVGGLFLFNASVQRRLLARSGTRGASAIRSLSDEQRTSTKPLSKLDT